MLNYFYASKRAESLLKYDIDGVKELLEKALVLDYTRLIKDGNYICARARAKKLLKIGTPDAQEMLERAATFLKQKIIFDKMIRLSKK